MEQDRTCMGRDILCAEMCEIEGKKPAAFSVETMDAGSTGTVDSGAVRVKPEPVEEEGKALGTAAEPPDDSLVVMRGKDFVVKLDPDYYDSEMDESSKYEDDMHVDCSVSDRWDQYSCPALGCLPQSGGDTGDGTARCERLNQDVKVEHGWGEGDGTVESGCGDVTSKGTPNQPGVSPVRDKTDGSAVHSLGEVSVGDSQSRKSGFVHSKHDLLSTVGKEGEKEHLHIGVRENNPVASMVQQALSQSESSRTSQVVLPSKRKCNFDAEVVNSFRDLAEKRQPKSANALFASLFALELDKLDPIEQLEVKQVALKALEETWRKKCQST